MQKRIKRTAAFLFFTLALFFSGGLKAAHLMGGDLTYKYIGNSKYALKFLIYRDANCKPPCASMPTSIDYYAYAGSYVAKKVYSVYSTHTVKLFSIGYVQPDAPNCASPT